MPRLVPLPESIAHAPFSLARAAEIGMSRGRLAGRDLIIPFRGVRDLRSSADGSLRRRCRQLAERMPEWQFFSHELALALVGAPTPRWPYNVGLHVSAHRPQREPRVAGVVGHRLQTRDAAHLLLDGLRIEHPIRAWRQTGGIWSHDNLVAAADFIVADGRWGTASDLLEEVNLMGGRFAPALRRAVADVRFGSESPEETKLRLVLARAGLPEPELNWVLRDEGGRLIARLDLAYPRWRVGAEYDGRVHAEDARQFARDADRWAAIKRQAWDHVRILRHHMRGDGHLAVALVREALVRAGWRP